MDNYFELYGLQEQFSTDKAAVRRKFLELSREFHPDRFATADSALQVMALSKASANNNAYKTLMDDDAAMAYLLRLKGVIAEEEKYTLPQDFLMDMMDLNEVVTEYEQAPDNTYKQAASEMLEQEMAQWQAAIQPLVQQHDAGDTSPGLLAKIKDQYFRRKYLLRIQERLNTFAV